MYKQQFVIIGLGVFGETIATELTRLGHDVLGIDTDEVKVDRLAEKITHAVIGDVTEESVLDELNVGDYDVGVVAIGRNIEAAILATMQLRDRGVKKVWAKALTNQHHRILKRLGATRVIGPEFEMGAHVAQELHYPMVNNYIGLGEEEFIVELIVSDNLDGCQMDTLIEKADAEVELVLVKQGKKTSTNPPNDITLHKGNQVVLVGQLDELRKFADHL
ncbi:potassium channel family protein [Marinobacter sp. 1Y8]